MRDAGLREGRGARAEVHPLPHDGPVLAHAGRAARRAATTTPSGWAASPRSRPAPRATARCAPTRARRWPRRCGSTGTTRPSSASATRCRCGRRARSDRSTTGRTPGGGFEYFYGFLGGETNQWYPAIYENTIAGRAVGHARAGLPLHGRHDRQGDRLDPPAEVARAGQAVLHLLRSRGDPRPAPRPDRSGPTSTPGSSTRAGTRCARRPSPGRRSWGSSRRTPCSPSAARASRRGTR